MNGQALMRMSHLLMSEGAGNLSGSVVCVQVDVVVGVGIATTSSDNVDTGQDGGYKCTLYKSVHDACGSGEPYRLMGGGVGRRGRQR